MLRFESVTRAYDGVLAVDSITAQMPAGAVYAIVGPNGAGKTTILNLVSGLDRPTMGAITLDGTRIDGGKPWQMAALGIARLFQDPRVFDSLTLEENMAVTPRSKSHLPPGLRSVRNEMLKAVEYESRPNLPARQLSFGQKKLLALARLIHPDFRVLLLDEPTAGIHPDLHPCILDLLRAWADDGRLALVVEHNRRFVSSAADRALTLSAGRLVSDGVIHHERTPI